MKASCDLALALIIDDQVRLLPSIDQQESLLKHTGILLEGFHLLNLPLLITQQYTKGLGMSDPSIFSHAHTTNYLEKRTFSCWQDEGIRNAILASQRKQMILCGVEAHICVQQTALDLLDAGFDVFLVEDCISSRRTSDKQIALRRMEQAGVILTSYEALLFELMETSLHPQFKAISALIK